MESNEWKYAPVEMAKKLQELGVVLDTEKYWVRSLGTKTIKSVWVLVDKQGTLDQNIDPSVFTKAYIPAPDILELCMEAMIFRKKITTGEFSITEFEDDKVFIQRETGKDGGEGFGYSKDDFDKFIGEFFEKNM